MAQQKVLSSIVIYMRARVNGRGMSERGGSYAVKGGKCAVHGKRMPLLPLPGLTCSRSPVAMPTMQTVTRVVAQGQSHV